MGKELDESFVGDGYTLNVRGAAASDKTLFLLYDVTFTEEFLADNAISEEDMQGPSCFIMTGSSSTGTDAMYMSEGNTYSFYQLYHSHDESLAGKTAEVEFRNIHVGNDITIPCDHRFKLNIDFATTDNVGVYGLHMPIKVGEETIMLDKIVYDAFSIEFISNGVTPNSHGEIWDTLFTGHINKTDGTQVSLLSAGGMADGNTGVGSFIADYALPILPEEIESITFGEYTIPLT